MTRFHAFAGLAAGALLLAACGGGSTATATTSVGSASDAHPAKATVAVEGNRVIAQQAVDRLVHDAALPPGTVALATRRPR